jgi:hypothetical protein
MRIRAASFAALLALPAASAAQTVDHLEILAPPKLTRCSNSLPYFRVVVNAVDATGKPVSLGVSAADARKYFQVTERTTPHTVRYVGLGEGSTTSAASSSGGGSYVMLLLDTSGSMNARVEGGTRFTQAKAAVRQAIANFNEGVDHFAVVPFDSHNVVSRIRGAQFQTTRQGIEAQLDAIPEPDTKANNTAIYSAVNEALPVLRDQSEKNGGALAQLVVFSDGANDVGHPGDDKGLLGPEGFNIVRDAAQASKIAITTVGFGIRGNVQLETVLKSIAWPTSESYYDVESSPERLKAVFSTVLRKLSDRIPILYGPVRKSRDELAGQPIPFTVRYVRDKIAAAAPEQMWNPPAVGVPVAEVDCSRAEITVLTTEEPPPPQTDPTLRRLMIFGLFALVLAALWFAAPRFAWPEAYIPRPHIPTAPSLPPIAGGAVQLQGPPQPQVRGPQFQQPAFDPQARTSPQPRQSGGGGGGGGGYGRPPAGGGGGGGGDSTVYVPARPSGGTRPSIASTPRAPRTAEPPASHQGDDATVYKPIDSPKRDR